MHDNPMIFLSINFFHFQFHKREQKSEKNYSIKIKEKIMYREIEDCYW